MCGSQRGQCRCPAPVWQEQLRGRDCSGETPGPLEPREGSSGLQGATEKTHRGVNGGAKPAGALQCENDLGQLRGMGNVNTSLVRKSRP